MPVMLAEGAREMVGTGEVALRAEEHVFMVLVVQHGVYGARRRHPDGTGRQTGIFIGVVGRINGDVPVEDALDGEVP